MNWARVSLTLNLLIALFAGAFLTWLCRDNRYTAGFYMLVTVGVIVLLMAEPWEAHGDDSEHL